jgi:hypothetical protein
MNSFKKSLITFVIFIIFLLVFSNSLYANEVNEEYFALFYSSSNISTINLLKGSFKQNKLFSLPPGYFIEAAKFTEVYLYRECQMVYIFCVSNIGRLSTLFFTQKEG